MDGRPYEGLRLGGPPHDCGGSLFVRMDGRPYEGLRPGRLVGYVFLYCDVRMDGRPYEGLRLVDLAGERAARASEWTADPMRD